MSDTDSVSRARVRGWRHAWAVWTVEQRTAALAAVLLIGSTLGSFSFVEVALVAVDGAVLLLLRSRAAGRRFALPLTDRALLTAAGAWSGVLIGVRMFDRPVGQTLLALFCAALLALAGLLDRGAERALGAEPTAIPAPPEPQAEPEAPAVVAPPNPPATAGVTWLHAR